MSKQRPVDPVDYTVMALEGLWWVEGADFEITRPEGWRWTDMIMQPDHITEATFGEALQHLCKKRPGAAAPGDLSGRLMPADPAYRTLFC